MKKSMRYLTVLVAVMALGSALFAAPGAGNNCSSTTTLNTATWGGGGGFGGPLKSSSATCNPTSVTVASPDRSEHGNGIAHAFGKLVKSLGTSLETAIWGFTPPPPR